MQFRCEVKTIKGQPDYETTVEAPNQGVAKTRAQAEAKANGLEPSGRTKALKIPS